MPLDAKGDIGAAAIAFYGPVFIVALILSIRDKTRAYYITWEVLALYAAIRITGAALLIHLELFPKSSTKALMIVAIATINAGLTPLMLANVDLCIAVTRRSHLKRHFYMRFGDALITLALLGAFACSVSGGVIGFQNRPALAATARRLRNAGGGLFIGAFVLLSVQYAKFFWRKDELRPAPRRLLHTTVVAFPFLIVRVTFAGFSGFLNPKNRLLPAMGHWPYYFAMVYIMEYIVVCIYFYGAYQARMSHDVDEQEAKVALDEAAQAAATNVACPIDTKPTPESSTVGHETKPENHSPV